MTRRIYLSISRRWTSRGDKQHRVVQSKLHAMFDGVPSGKRRSGPRYRLTRHGSSKAARSYHGALRHIRTSAGLWSDRSVNSAGCGKVLRDEATKTEPPGPA